MTTHVAGLPIATVPWVLAAIGLGMTVGNALGGYCSDRNLRRSLLTGFPVFIAAMVVLRLRRAHAAPACSSASFLVGATSLFLGPAMQSRLISVAPGAPMMGAAVNQSAMNIANSLGALLGGIVISSRARVCGTELGRRRTGSDRVRVDRAEFRS